MNRFFPGNEDAGPTQSISGFVTTHLIPISDIIMDFHSVGTSAEYANCGFHCRGDNETLNATNLDLVGTFSAPFTIVCPLEGYSGDFDSAAYAQGTPFLSYELGGMGRVSNETLKISWKGCLKVLNRAGLIGDDVLDAQTNNELDRPTRFVDLGEGCHHITASTYGVADQHLERCHRL
jgi:N-alpha-acetyl-L-2,4-diaminobutyrate deacetylase